MSDMVPSTEELIQLALEGNKLNPQMIGDLELLLRSNPDDLRTRVKLLGFYDTRYHRNPQYQKQRDSHILWLVSNLTEHQFLSESFGKVIKSIEPEFYQSVKSFWLSRIKSNPRSIQILINAAAALIPSDLEEAKVITLDAEVLDPTCPEVKYIWERIRQIETRRAQHNHDQAKSDEYP